MARTDEYLETKVMTATPQQLHLLVVDGAIRAANRAAEALEKKDFETAHLSLNDARGLVGELLGGLDADKAPELVEKMKGLFLFVYRNLMEADRDQDSTRVQSALKILRIHRETWMMLIDRLGAGTGAASARTKSPEQPRSWVT
jgi:flagellar protein FliS